MAIGRARLGVIFLTVFIDLAGFGIILPVMPYYAQRFGAEAFGYGALIGVFSLMQFVSTMVLGRLSDRIGRRPVLLTTITIAALGYLAFAFAQSYWMLFAARMVAGFAAGNISVAQAYIADVTTPSERSRGMGLIGAAFGIGFVVGPALGGVAVHYGGPPAAGLAAATLCGINFISAASLLKESLHAEHRVHRPLLDVAHMRRGLTDARMGPLFMAFGLIPFAFSGYMVAFPLFAGADFGWAERELAVFFTMVGAVAAVVQGWFFGRISRVLRDRTLVVLGILGLAASLGAVSFARSSAALYAIGAVIAFSNGIGQPALTGLISKLADVREQGAMLGAAQSLSALGRLSGPFLFGQLYDVLSPSAAFFGAAGVMVLAALVTLRARGVDAIGGARRGRQASQAEVVGDPH
jgi:MFS family permease